MFGTGDTRTSTLRRASSVVFALISVLPLLLFAYTLYALQMLHHAVAQIGLGSALLLSMLGFYIYSVMMSRLAEVLRDLEAGESAPPRSGDRQGAVMTMAAEPGRIGPTPARLTGSVPRQDSAPATGMTNPSASRSRPGAGRRGELVVPGIGRITTLKSADARALSDLDFMWRAEAEPLLGRRVLVAVRNAQDPMTGILAEVTQHGVVLDQGGSPVDVSYGRISMIEADASAGSA